MLRYWLMMGLHLEVKFLEHCCPVFIVRGDHEVLNTGLANPQLPYDEVVEIFSQCLIERKLD